MSRSDSQRRGAWLLKVTLACLTVLYAGSPSVAQTPEVHYLPDDAVTVREFWTPSAIQSARQLTPIASDASLPRLEQPANGATVDGDRGAAAWSATIGASYSGTAEYPNERSRRLSGSRLASQSVVRVESSDQGAARLAFTSSRLTPLAADLEYPFRAIGRLFLVTPAGPGSCSAAVVAPRLVLTAGHCVHSGTPTGYYSAFLFVPAYRQGNAPYGDWVGTAVVAPAAWVNGKGRLPNLADYALIEIEDEIFQGQLGRLAEVVGAMPMAIKPVFPHHVHMFGYPLNLDGGEVLHSVSAGVSRRSKFMTVLFGSDMAQGASGGPWIVNLGAPAAGQVSGPRNVIVGVASFLAPGLVNGSSLLNAPLVQIYNAICANRFGNC